MLFIALAFANYSHASKPNKLTKTITWELKDDGTLIISGKGDMPDYEYDFSGEYYCDETPPWSKYIAENDISITSVIIEEGITSIGDFAFESYYFNLDVRNLTIPNSVISIGDYAFFNNSITTLTIPNSVTTIGKYAFCENKITTLTIPNSVTTIGDRAFGHNEITTLTIPDSITSIGDSVFFANKITTVNIPNSVTSIGDHAFGCNNITTLTIPDSVTVVGDHAFRFNNITTLKLSNSVISIGDAAFDDNDITDLIIPNSVTDIGWIAFHQNKITTLNIPDSVITIDDEAFRSNNITTLTISNSVTSIGAKAFSSNDITSLTIPNSVTSIGTGAFSGNDIASLTLPNSITSIDDWVFANNNIETLTIPNSVTSIGIGAFFNNNIKSLNIPDSVKSIGDNAFAPKRGEVFSARIIHLPSWVTDKNCERMGISLDSYYEYGTPTVEWLLKKSIELYDNNNYEEALKYILRAINNEATSAPTVGCYNLAGVYYFALGRYKEALNMLLMAAYLRATAIKVVDIKTANFKETDLKATDIKVANDTSLGVYAHNIGDCYRMLNDNKRAREWYMVGSGYGYASALEKLHKYYDVTASASVDKIWVANTDDNSIFHLNNLRVNYAYNEKATLILHIYDENKRQLTDKNNKYYSSDGYVQFNYEIASAPYIYTIWEDFTITVPTSEIHIDRTKKSRTPYCKLIVKDKDGKIVYTSPYFQFTLDKIETAAPAPTTTSAKKSSTTETAKTQTQTQTQTQTKTQTQTQQAYTPEYGYRDMWVTCTSCAGTGICPSCHGVGHVHGTYVQVCGFCGGTKACPFCGGRGGHYEKVQYQIR